MLRRSRYCPFRPCLKLCSLVQLGCQIQVIHFWRLVVNWIKHYEWINLEVCEMQINKDGVQSTDELDKHILFGQRNIGEKTGFNFLGRWKGCVDRDQEFERFGIYVAYVNAALVREENVVAITY